MPGWTGYNLQSRGFVPCKPCTLHYCARSLGQAGEAGRSCQDVQGATSCPGVSFLANPVHVHYIIVQEVLDKQEKQGEVARVDGVQPPVQWFCSSQTLYITLLRKKSGTRRRSREKLPGWTGYNLQSRGFVPCKPCKLHYYIRSLGQGGGAGRSCQGEHWTGYNLESSGFIPCKPCALHYYVRSLGQGGGAGRSCQSGQGATSSLVVLFLANPVYHTIR